MIHRSRTFAIAMAVAMLSTAILAQKKDDKTPGQGSRTKQDEQQRKEIQALVKIADDVAAGQTLPNDLGVTWVRDDVLKAQGNKQYVPFVVTVDRSKVTGGTLSFYWRVTAQSAAQPAVQPAAGDARKNERKDKDRDKDNKGKSDYPYEDVSFVPIGSGEAGNPMRIERSFMVPAGSYDVLVVAREQASSQKNAPTAKVSVLKQPVTVPDFWNDELNTSSVIVAQEIKTLPAPLKPEEQGVHPYVLGTQEIVPRFELSFSKKDELQLIFLVYNPKLDSANKPNVMIEYTFYVKQQGGEKPFNHTQPQYFNAETMPGFDAAAGHQIPGGQAIPLGSFPEGAYRLEVKVTDKLASKTLTRDVNFTVTAS